MKVYQIAIVLLLIIVFGCHLNQEYPLPFIRVYRLEPSPMPADTTYIGYYIEKYSNERDLLICVSDQAAALKNINGKNLTINISTTHGENENLLMDGKDIVQFDYSNNNAMHYFKRINPITTSNPIANNNIIEIYNVQDTILIKYISYHEPEVVIIDTLVYN